MNLSLVVKSRLSNARLVSVALLVTTVLVLILCFFFEPRWETNDDVAMSMVAHGYGVASTGSPNLVFSNVLWGYLVRAIPAINGVSGYATATLSVLVIIGAVIIYGLYQFGQGLIACLSIMVLIIVRAVLFPQFTINAGLLLVAGIICWHVYVLKQEKGALLLGSLLAFCSFLVRREEFVLVLLVALPLLQWRILLSGKFAQAVFSVLACAIALSVFIDHQAYQGTEWNTFRETGSALRPLVDFGAGDLLKQRPEILSRYGYSANDIDLIKSWFFVDLDIINPKVLQSMLADLGPLQTQGNAMANGWTGVKDLFNPILWIMIAGALLMISLRPHWRLGAGWALFIAAIFILGLLGRPGILRVYVPIVSLLLIAPFLMPEVAVSHKWAIKILFILSVLNTLGYCVVAKNTQVIAEQTRKELADFTDQPVIVWADSFPFQDVYPVLGSSASAMSYRLYGLGALEHAPFSTSYTQQQAGQGMINLLMTEAGASIIASEQQFKYLADYCSEHLHGQLEELSRQKYGKMVLSQRRCKI